MRNALIIAMLILVLVPPAATGQAICAWYTELSGQEVVPPSNSPGTGVMDAAFFEDDHEGLCCAELEEEEIASLRVRLTYRNLEGSPTGAYIYSGTYGSNGERLYILWDESFSSASTVDILFDPEDCWLVESEDLYVIVTTDRYSDGEIRGQITLAPSPTIDVTWGRIRGEYR